MANTPQTLQQERAASAWAQIGQVEVESLRFSDKKNQDKYKNKYGSLMRGLPAMILSDGLAPTLAFLLAKGKRDSDKPEEVAHYSAYYHLSIYVCQRLNADQDLLQWVLQKSSADYRRAASESLAYLHWLKRFVEAKNWRSDEE
jgi:CRISPR type III-B/RAMP module-associated protein Cmr5